MNTDAIFNLLDDVPDYQSFLTVTELDDSMHRLAQQYPKAIQLLHLGQSRQGSPITAMKIGSGPRAGLLFAMPHPNEPIGSMMLEFLTARLAQDDELRRSLGYTWYIIKCADPDGTRLNEGWFKGPFSLTNYARHYYRPPLRLQVEWSFPIDYKTLHFNDPLPETRALMKLMDQVRPDFMYSLHNSGFGGVYAYITHDTPAFYPDFYRLVESQGLPLHLGESELPWAVTFSQAIFKELSRTESYEFKLKNGVPDPAAVMTGGAGSYDYVSRSGDPRCIVCEMPYFYNPSINDISPSDMIRRNAVMEDLRATRELLAFFQAQYDAVKAHLSVPSPFRDSIEDLINFYPGELIADENWARSDPSLSAHASVAEKFSNLFVKRFYNLLNVGMFLRMLEAEIAARGPRPPLLDTLQAFEDRFKRDAAALENDLQYEVVPIQKLVRVQLAAGLLYSGYAK